MCFKRWTSEEIRFITEHINLSNKELSQILGRSESSVSHKKSSLGIIKSVKVDLNLIRKEFESLGWVLLSGVYVNSHTKLKYKCDKGHIHSITWNKFKERRRCPKCYYEAKDFFSRVKIECRNLGYIVLTKVYLHSKQPLHIKCSRGHIFTMSWNSIQVGSRCPKCTASSKVSSQERDIFNLVCDIIGSTNVFTNIRSVIYPYELDIYIPSKTLAIEYCGLYWHSSLNGKSNEYHLNKLKMCEDTGIKLITVFEDDCGGEFNPLLVMLNYLLLGKYRGFNPNKVYRFTDCGYFISEGSFNGNFMLENKDRCRCLSVYNNLECLLDVVYFVENKEINIVNTHYYNVFTKGVLFLAIEEIMKNNSICKVNYLHDNRRVCLERDEIINHGFSFVGKLDPSYSYISKHRRIGKSKKMNGKIWDCGYDKFQLIKEVKY